MQYKFNRPYLYSLLCDCKKQYKNGIISKSDYELLKYIIKELIYGSKQNNYNIDISNIDFINDKLNRLRNELGMDVIEKLLYISASIIRDGKYIELPSDCYKQTSKNLVENVLEFYYNCDEQKFKYLSNFVSKQISQIEIVSGNRTRFSNNLLILPFYNLEFLRICKNDRLYDEACLCHELRHSLDIKEMNINSLDFNIFSETNAIAMELYYGLKKSNINSKYKVGIKDRMNDLMDKAININIYMDLLINTEKCNSIKKAIDKMYCAHKNTEIQDVLADLNSGSVYDDIIYFVGILKGIYLSEIALQDPKSSFELQDKICSIMNTEQFIPHNIENILGKDFKIGIKDAKTYKKFIRKLK